jgi:HPt (histidine-containing phosphotransfer) domain-containing protein
MSGHDRAFFLVQLARLLRDSASAVADTRRALLAGDRETASRRMHSLKGNAGNLGALDLMQTAAALETAIKEQAPDLESGLADLERQLHALATASDPWLATAERPGEARAAAPPAGPAAPLDPARLADLRLALQRQDLAAMDLFEELAPSLRAARGEAATQALGEAIADLRFDAALAGMAVDSLRVRPPHEPER